MDDYSAFAAYQHSTAIAHTDDIGGDNNLYLWIWALGWEDFTTSLGPGRRLSWAAHMDLDTFFFFFPL